MKLKGFALSCVLICAPVFAAGQDDVAPDLFTYDVPQLQRVMRAISMLDTVDAQLSSYDRVLYSQPKEWGYLVTFSSSVLFAEDGPLRGPEIRMLFNIKTDAVIAIEVDQNPELDSPAVQD